MEWSLAREDLEELVASGLQAMDDTVQAAWAAMRIEPERWQCSPWGDEGGGFWVVAEKDGQVVWYNDIEDGFNISRFTTRGIIADYACNQTSFEEFLLALPEAHEAESWSDPTKAVPSELEGGGTIVRRQTTYWDLMSAGGAPWRLRFKAKAETRFVTSQFTELRLVDSHPILRQYVEPWSALYFTGTPSDAPNLRRALAEIVSADSAGWRTLEEYLNGSAKLVGGGLLMRAPRSLAGKAAGLLKEIGLTPSVLDGVQLPESPRAIIMDGNVIVAREFRFERFDAA
jgi:hypothetical protein